jgi:hypothetical protein
MKWIKERDALIAQTMAFVQSVSSGRDDVGRIDPGPYRAAANRLQANPEPAAAVVSMPPQPTESPTLPKIVPLSRSFNQVDVKTEIRARIASFRAHQERFNRERHEYFSATLAQLRAAIDQLPPPDAEK